jgi:hypothetical protein
MGTIKMRLHIFQPKEAEVVHQFVAYHLVGLLVWAISHYEVAFNQSG